MFYQQISNWLFGHYKTLSTLFGQKNTSILKRHSIVKLRMISRHYILYFSVVLDLFSLKVEYLKHTLGGLYRKVAEACVQKLLFYISFLRKSTFMLLLLLG
jgi:hypothetical protein